MNRDFVARVSTDFPDLLPTNLGRTCFKHTTILIDRLRALGHDVAYVAKSPGEGQYTPPGFVPFTIIGLDGKKYPCSGVSHDAIFFDGEQFDTLAGANEHDQFIYRKSTAPFWSFDPNDGPKITASPAWNQIPREHWRANNPPLRTIPQGPAEPEPGPTPTPGPTPAPVPVVMFPPRDLVGHAFGAINDRYRRGGRQQRIHPELIDAGDQPLYVDNEGLFVWLSEYMRHFATHPAPDVHGRHAAALDTTLRAIEAAWPK